MDTKAEKALKRRENSVDVGRDPRGDLLEFQNGRVSANETDEPHERLFLIA